MPHKRSLSHAAQRTRSLLTALIGVALLLIGLIAVFFLATSNQDLRQQASGGVPVYLCAHGTNQECPTGLICSNGSCTTGVEGGTVTKVPTPAPTTSNRMFCPFLSGSSCEGSDALICTGSLGKVRIIRFICSDGCEKGHCKPRPTLVPTRVPTSSRCGEKGSSPIHGRCCAGLTPQSDKNCGPGPAQSPCSIKLCLP
jgi:hypothetical protein